MDIKQNQNIYYEELIEKQVRLGCKAHYGNLLIDAGIETPGGWAAGKLLLQMLTAGLGEITFENTTCGEEKLPTVGLYLDNPVVSTQTFFNGENGYAYIQTEALPSSVSVKTVTARPDSLVDYIYEAGKALPLLVKEVLNYGIPKEDILWGFGSAPIIFKHNHPEGTQKDKQTMMQNGALASLWVQNQEDGKLQEFFKAWHGPGEARLHNINSGNTFIGGSLNEENLVAYLKA